MNCEDHIHTSVKKNRGFSLATWFRDIDVNTLEGAQLGITPRSVPLTNSATLPEASRRADPPANTTNAAYEIAEIIRASNVPFGIELAGSLKSPEMFAPACKPVTAVKTEWLIFSPICSFGKWKGNEPLGKNIANTLKKLWSSFSLNR